MISIGNVFVQRIYCTEQKICSKKRRRAEGLIKNKVKPSFDVQSRENLIYYIFYFAFIFDMQQDHCFCVLHFSFPSVVVVVVVQIATLHSNVSFNNTKICKIPLYVAGGFGYYACTTRSKPNNR